jgi:hypothetical protein
MRQWHNQQYGMDKGEGRRVNKRTKEKIEAKHTRSTKRRK